MLRDSKIYLITYMEKGRELVSHGIGDYTLKTYVLSQDPIGHYKPKRDYEGWYVDGPAKKEVKVRLMVRNGKVWEQQADSMTASDLSRVCWDLDGHYAVVADDQKGVYYCGREDLIESYRAKGKTALPFVELERRLFYDLASFENAPVP